MILQLNPLLEAFEAARRAAADAINGNDEVTVHDKGDHWIFEFIPKGDRLGGGARVSAHRRGAHQRALYVSRHAESIGDCCRQAAVDHRRAEDAVGSNVVSAHRGAADMRRRRSANQFITTSIEDVASSSVSRIIRKRSALGWTL